MNVGELRQALTAFPSHMPILVFFDRKVRVTTGSGDRIDGTLTEYFEPIQVNNGEEVCSRGGFVPIAVMTVEEESG